MSDKFSPIALDNLINDKETFEESFIKELDRISARWGDDRRTKVINLDFSSEADDAEPIEKKEPKAKKNATRKKSK